MSFVLGLGLTSGLVWACTMAWGAFPPPRVAIVQDVAAGLMVACAIIGLLHGIWVTSP